MMGNLSEEMAIEPKPVIFSRGNYFCRLEANCNSGTSSRPHLELATLIRSTSLAKMVSQHMHVSCSGSSPLLNLDIVKAHRLHASSRALRDLVSSSSAFIRHLFATSP